VRDYPVKENLVGSEKKKFWRIKGGRKRRSKKNGQLRKKFLSGGEEKMKIALRDKLSVDQEGGGLLENGGAITNANLAFTFTQEIRRKKKLKLKRDCDIAVPETTKKKGTRQVKKGAGKSRRHAPPPQRHP